MLASRSPVAVELGFRSPYGYATAEAIVEFDYHVRLVQTLIRGGVSDAISLPFDEDELLQAVLAAARGVCP